MVDRVIKNWLEYIDFEQLKVKIKGRKVYIWGVWKYSAPVAEACRENGIDNCSIVEGENEYIGSNGIRVEKSDKVHESEDAFVIITVINSLSEIQTKLAERGFLADKDYIAIHKHYVIEYYGGYYEDLCGNIINSDDYRETPVKIELKGYNNHIRIGRNVEFKKCEVACWYGAALTFASRSEFVETYIWASEEGQISIGEGCVFAKGCEVLARGKMEIGNGFTIEKDGVISADYESPIKIGNDCMCSISVHIWSNNSHALMDLEAKENTGLSKKHYVSIGNHVWLGDKTTVLYNAEIEDNSIVGACSLVNKSFPANCVIAGNPAKVLKENYSWDRRPRMTYEEFISGQ